MFRGQCNAFDDGFGFELNIFVCDDEGRIYRTYFTNYADVSGYVVWSTFAADVVAGVTDTNGQQDLYLYNVSTGENTLISHDSTNTAETCSTDGFGGSINGRISDAGAYVAFQSDCTNLADNQGATADRTNIYRWNRTSSTTIVVSHVSGNPDNPGNGDSVNSVISASGDHIAYITAATNFSPFNSDSNGLADVAYWRAAIGNLSQLNTYLSMAASGFSTANGFSTTPSMDNSGEYVAYETFASDITNDVDSNNAGDIILMNIPLGAAPTSTLVSRNTADTGAGNSSSLRPTISGDGTTVAYLTFATNIVDAGTLKSTGAISDVLAFSRMSGDNVLVSRSVADNEGGDGDSGQPSFSTGLDISDDGNEILFTSESANLDIGDDANNDDVYLAAGPAPYVPSVLSVAVGGGEGNGDSTNATISGNGDFVVFRSTASDLTADPSAASADIYADYTLFREDPIFPDGFESPQ